MGEVAVSDPAMQFNFSRENLPKESFVNNAYIQSSCTKKLTLLNPKDNTLVANDVDVAGETEVDAAVSAAENAFPAWKRLPAVQRKGILEKFANLVEANREKLNELTRITLGCPKSSQDIDFLLQVQCPIPCFGNVS